MLRYLLVFAIGLLLGANVAWYYAGSRAPACTPTAPVNSAAATATIPHATPPANASATLPTKPAVVPTTPLPSGLIIPVQGITADRLTDTFTQARSEGRVHEAIDIMAPAGTPVLAAVDGPVAKLFNSARGGITIYQFDPQRVHVYYYAHLQSYAPGLAEGQLLRQGQVIGFVGSTGDASPSAPHLHFTVGELGPEKQYWKSTALNPFPLLGGVTR